MDLSVIAMMGIILLIGIVKKNGIMPVDFALQVERSEGLGLEDSIYRACIMRFRPILTTTMAGLALAQVLTLYTIPVVFLYLDRFIRRSRRSQPTKKGNPVRTASENPAAE